MANSRYELQDLLENLLGSRNVYFQPPENVAMEYPCIVYSLSKIHVSHANNLPYWTAKSYTITIIDEDPDSDLPDKMIMLPCCVMDRGPYVADNLNHWVFQLYY